MLHKKSLLFATTSSWGSCSHSISHTMTHPATLVVPSINVCKGKYSHQAHDDFRSLRLEVWSNSSTVLNIKRPFFISFGDIFRDCHHYIRSTARLSILSIQPSRADKPSRSRPHQTFGDIPLKMPDKPQDQETLLLLIIALIVPAFSVFMMRGCGHEVVICILLGFLLFVSLSP